jgi:hypothetical protein
VRKFLDTVVKGVDLKSHQLGGSFVFWDFLTLAASQAVVFCFMMVPLESSVDMRVQITLPFLGVVVLCFLRRLRCCPSLGACERMGLVALIVFFVFLAAVVVASSF